MILRGTFLCEGVPRFVFQTDMPRPDRAPGAALFYSNPKGTHTLSSSAAKNAYSFDDLSRVIRIYNSGAELADLVALAEACSFFAVEARRSIHPEQ